MIYEQLYRKAGDRRVRAALIGAGQYGTGLLAQSLSVERLQIVFVCDRDLSAMLKACAAAGLAGEAFAICETRQQALRALESGKRVAARDASLAFDLPLDVVVECTGGAEAGARHAEAALLAGKHVVMVNKEAESVVGPMLRRIAERHGLVYAPADGDQPALLIQLVSWARTLGLHVLCGGKSRDMEYILREREGCVSDRFGKAAISAEDAWAFEPVRGDDAEEKMLARRIALASLRQAQDYDLCETAIMANATGLMPDKPALHAPVCRISEIPSMLCPRGRGGVLAREGAIDLVTCLRRPDEAGLGGGVFAVVACENAYARETLARKGLISNPARDCHLIYRPSHLLGIETPTSALCAALLGVPTGGAEVEPRVDLVAAPVRNISAGETVEIRRGGKEELKAWLEPARPIEDGAPAPLHLAEGCRLKRHAAAGEPIRVDMLEEPPGSRLWALRREQDSRFAIRRA